MTTVTKFYLHDAETSIGGTLPSASIVSTTSVLTITGRDVNRVMDGDISLTNQVTVAYTTGNNQNAQQSWIRRWVSDPLGVNNFGSGSINKIFFSLGGNVSNTQTQFGLGYAIGIWRPSTGSLVGLMINNTATSTNTSFNLTAQTNVQFAFTSMTAQSSQEGDILVMEHWRSTAVQGMSTSYTNRIFYDGTTENSTSNIASMMIFRSTGDVDQPIEMASPPALLPNDTERIVSQAVQRSAVW